MIACMLNWGVLLCLHVVLGLSKHLESRLHRFQVSQTVYVHCRSTETFCPRSALSAARKPYTNHT